MHINALTENWRLAFHRMIINKNRSHRGRFFASTEGIKPASLSLTAIHYTLSAISYASGAGKEDNKLSTHRPITVHCTLYTVHLNRTTQRGKQAAHSPSEPFILYSYLHSHRVFSRSMGQGSRSLKMPSASACRRSVPHRCIAALSVPPVPSPSAPCRRN